MQYSVSIQLWTRTWKVGNAKSTKWQIKVKHLRVARGAKFPVLSSGAKRYAAIREKWEHTPEGRARREKLDVLRAQPDVVGKPWVQEEDKVRAAMKA